MQPPINYARDPQTYAIIGTAMAAHRELGCGFLEAVYAEALAMEFGLGSIPFRREVPLVINYRGRSLQCGYRADFVVFDQILVENKATRASTDIDRAQVLNYLKATGLRRAMLFNYGPASLAYERIVHNYSESAPSA